MFSNNYGTWTTFDAPMDDKERQEAFEWLEAKFDEIDGYVWKKKNPHDFTDYYSFEIDCPEKFEYVEECYEDCDESCSDCKLYYQKEKWSDLANEIEREYSKKFFSDK